MKRLVLVGLVLGLITPSLIAGPMVKIERVSGYFSGNGGEFTITPIGWSPWWNGYVEIPSVKETKNIGTTTNTFQTFCVEDQEFVTPGTTYAVEITDRAIKGDVGLAGDPVSVGTAWLYYEFAKGTLTGYNYTLSTGLRATTAGQLQEVIWWLEEEITTAPSNPFYAAVLGKFGSLGAARADNSGRYPVRVLNLYDAKTKALKQDQLVVIPEPGTLILVGLGASAFGLANALRRRRGK